MTSERVDKQGVQNIAQAAKQHLKFRTRREAVEVLPMRTTADLQQWQQLDDPIMGELPAEAGLCQLVPAYPEPLCRLV